MIIVDIGKGVWVDLSYSEAKKVIPKLLKGIQSKLTLNTEKLFEIKGKMRVVIHNIPYDIFLII